MDKAAEKELRKKTLRLRMYYLLIALSVLLGGYLIFEIIFAFVAK